MSNKEKTLASSMGDLIGKKQPAVNVIENDIVNVNSLKSLLHENTEKKQLVGVYFEPEIAELLKKVSNKRGDQSKIVNEAVRRLMQANGLI